MRGGGCPKEKRVACTLPRVAREAVSLQEPLIQGDSRAGVALGLWGPRRGSPCCYTTHPRVSSSSTGEV